MREERKVVTALFADLVGSTSLAEQLDPEDVRLVVGEGVARVVAEVERFGGHVKDLAGDGVLAFFGAPVASEDDPERAVRAGLRIADEIGAYGDEVARGFGVQGFAVRVGIGTGPVVLGQVGGGSRVEYAAFGDTVNVAARLQGAARPGTVLVDEATRRLAGPVFAWGKKLTLELKGKAEPVAAYEVAAVKPGSAKLRGLEGATTGMHGRERELAAGLDALAGLRAGAGGILFVTGEAGIGKSRLLHELQEAFEGEWLEGRCVSYGESLPYWPFRELLRGWLGVGVDDPELRARIAVRRQLERLFGERAEELSPYLAALLGLTLEPEASVRLGELSPEALQYRTFEVVEMLLERLAAERPIVVALEDLHWADSTSVQLLERLLAAGERGAVLLVLAQREDREHPSWRLKERATREYPHLTLDLHLEPLTGAAERELLHGLVGAHTLPEELERRILDTAEGNPFFLEELVRSLVDAQALVREESGWRLDHDIPFEVPETVEKVVLARIDRLPDACHDVLVAASALGRHFGLPLLEGVLESANHLDDALHELQRLDLLRTSRRWPELELRFKHVLIQETAYRTLLAEPRRRLHRLAAEWLERRHAGNQDEVLGLLAHHWLGAEDGDKAVTYLVRAGDRARAEWALDEAVAHYRTLVPLLERRGERQEVALVLFKLGLALHTALRFAEANTAYGRAFELWHPPAPCLDPAATLRLAATRLPSQPDPPRSYQLPDIQLQMALFDRLVERWPEATIVPSLAEKWEVSDDGLRYVFLLREGLTWSDGTPLTAGDVEHGIKRSLDPRRPGVSVAMFYVLENGQQYALGRSHDADAIGVRALDDRTVEFRLVAPAPYFLSVVNRPDGGPQPRHAVNRDGDAWTEPERQVVSGAFWQVERTPERVALERRAGTRGGNVGRVEIVNMSAEDAAEAYARDDIDVVLWSSGDSFPEADRVRGAAAGTQYLLFDHAGSPLADVELRRALAAALDRTELAQVMLPNTTVAAGGLVPPALQGHTPEIAPRYEPERAREHLRRSGFQGELALATPLPRMIGVLEAVAASWRRALELPVEVRLCRPEELEADRFCAAPIVFDGWFPGYPDPEYFLRLLLHSEAADNRGRWSHPPFDDLIEQARREPDGRRRLELFHQADRLAVADQVALIPLFYLSSSFHVKPWVHGWWEFGKSWSSFADLEVTRESPRFSKRRP